VLVVVKYRYVQLLLQALLYPKAPRSGNVLQVYSTEARCQELNALHDLVRVLRVETQRKGVYVRKLLEEHRLALHNRQRSLGSYVPESQDRRPVGDYGDGVSLDRQVESTLGFLGNCPAYPRYAGGVSHREVVARANRHLRPHLDLTTEVHQKRAVRDVDDVRLRQRLDRLDDPTPMLGIAGAHRDVTNAPVFPHPDDIDRPDHASGFADGRQDSTQRPAPVRELHPQGHAIACAGYRFHV
jgi:hypothetical protein